MVMRKIFFILLFLFPLCAFSAREVPFTLDDRDKLIKLEAGQDALRNEMNSLQNEMESLRNEMNSLRNEMGSLRNETNSRFESVQQQFKFVYWALSLIIALLVINLGYMIWDRRTAIYPMRLKLRYLEDDMEKLEKKQVEVDKIKTVLKEMGETDQKIKEILKRVAIF